MNRAAAVVVVALAFDGVPAAALRNTLASRGVAVSTGSACAERDARPSPAMKCASRMSPS